MKIEPRHNRKKPAYIAAAALMAASVLVSGCRPVGMVGGIQTDFYNDIFPEEGDVSSAGMICSSEKKVYWAYINEVRGIEYSDPGKYTYSLTSVYDDKNDGYFYVLTAWHDGEPLNLVYNSNWSWFEDDGAYGIDIDNSISYDEFINLPFLMDTRYFFHPEIGEDGIVSDVPVESVQMIGNGVYSGRLVAVSEDGDRGLFCISKALTFDRRMVRFLNSGDPIGVYDLTISEEIDSPDEDVTIITLESSCFDDLCLTTSPYDSNILCLTGSDGVWLSEPVLVELSLMSSCEVSENYDELYEGTISEDELTGNAFLDSCFWYYINESNSPWSNGWIVVNAPVDSLYVRGNTVFEINIDHE